MGIRPPHEQDPGGEPIHRLPEESAGAGLRIGGALLHGRRPVRRARRRHRRRPQIPPPPEGKSDGESAADPAREDDRQEIGLGER